MSTTESNARRRPTMRDVAAHVGVSAQTVSNLINRRFHLMTTETRTRIEQAMIELGYHPNVPARSMRSTRTYTFGFLVLDEGARFLADPMTDLILAGIADVTRDRGYGLLIQAARPDARNETLLRPLLEQRVDGAFLFLSGEMELRRWYVSRMVELGAPFVLFEEEVDVPSATCVTAANREGARRLTEHLLAGGHRRIAFLATRVPWPVIEQRHLGYRDALLAARVEPCPHLELFEGGWEASSGSAMATSVLSLAQPPTALICANDLLALGAMRAARELGRRVPDDVAVAGFDDFEFSKFVSPPLTTVRVPGYDMGRVGAELFVDRLENGQSGNRRVMLPVELQLRGSA